MDLFKLAFCLGCVVFLCVGCGSAGPERNGYTLPPIPRMSNAEWKKHRSRLSYVEEGCTSLKDRVFRSKVSFVMSGSLARSLQRLLPAKVPAKVPAKEIVSPHTAR